MIALLLALSLTGSGLLDEVVAVVADEPVLHSQVAELLAGTGRAEAALPGDPAYMRALDQLVEEKLLLEAARQAGFYPSQGEIEEMAEARMDSVRANFGGEGQLMEALAASGLSMAEFRRRTEEVVAAGRAVSDYLRYRTSRVMSTLPSEARGYLESHPDLVEQVAMPRRLSWIYLPVLPSMESCSAAFDTLEAVRQRILAGETSFADEARRLSDDASAEQGGDLGAFGRGEMTPTFENVAFSLDGGELSRPFRTPYGVHIVRVDTVMAADSIIGARHILLGVQRESGDVVRTMELADSLASLVERGADFSELAAEHSVDPDTRNLGGDLGTVLVRGWMPEVADALSGLESGGISEPVMLSGGTAVAVFRVEGAEGGIDFSQYPEAFLDELVRSVAYEDEYRSLIDSLRAEIPVLVYAEGDDGP